MHSDQHYIEALRNNDQHGIGQIYAKHAQEAIRWVTQHGGTAADARDVFQEAVLALYEKAITGTFVLTCPLGALLQVLYSRKWIDRTRAQKREERVRDEAFLRYDTEQAPEDLLALAEEATQAEAKQHALARAFDQLSDVCQRLLRLLAQGTQPKDAALELNMNSVDTLYRRKNACSERWRALVANGSIHTQ